ncbi:hypothetical protein SEA_KARDASHIAN_5 [Streptomyces phage Kardashian]|nr:hypothetical protein SEA_KARDASHIAN_5 [Streptomyces phage Kardashian]
MEPRILVSVKKVLGLPESDTSFDVDITMHINSAMARLNQLGIGPDEGFVVESDTDTWDSFLGTDPRLSQVRTYVYMSVRLVFDPPGTSYAIDSMKEQIDKFEWLLNAQREETRWTDPSLSL